MIIVEWLKWFFTLSGIVCVEESGRLGWFAALKNLFSGGVARKPEGPTHMDMVGYTKLGLNVKRRKCRVCGVHFWAWRRHRGVCYRWSCWRKRNEGK